MNRWDKASRRLEVVRCEGKERLAFERGGICEGIEELGDIVGSYQLTLILLMIYSDLGHRDENFEWKRFGMNGSCPLLVGQV